MKVPSRNNIFTISVALLVMGISAVIFISVKKDSDLPVYEGKTVEEWCYGEDGNPTSLSTRHDAAVAFEAVGVLAPVRKCHFSPE